MTPTLRTKRDIERATKVRLRGLRAAAEEPSWDGSAWLEHAPETTREQWRSAEWRRRIGAHKHPPIVRVTLERRTACPPHGVRVVTGCSEDVEPDCRDLRRATEAALVALDDAERAGHGHVEVRALMCACGEPVFPRAIAAGAVGLLQLPNAARCPLHKAGGLLSPSLAPTYPTMWAGQDVADDAAIAQLHAWAAEEFGIALDPSTTPVGDLEVGEGLDLVMRGIDETDDQLRARLLRRLGPPPFAPRIVHGDE